MTDQIKLKPMPTRAEVRKAIDTKILELLSKDLTPGSLETIERLSKVWETFSKE